MMYGAFQQSASHSQQAQAHQQHGLQAEHSSHGGASSSLTHHSPYPGGVLSSASPFSNGVQNGHGAAARTGQANAHSKHWTDQLRLYDESKAAHSTMTEQNQPNYYARLRASENRGIQGPSAVSETTTTADDGEIEDLRRPTAPDKATTTQQSWFNLDMSGQGLRTLSPGLFKYEFLVEIYIASNKLTSLPAEIGRLRQLKVLEVSHNQLTELPPELGMCTFLRELLLFNNQVRTLPYQLGSLYQLEVLGIEGNPLSMELKKEIMENGTKSLITFLRENSPSKSRRGNRARTRLMFLLTACQFHHHQPNVAWWCFEKTRPHVWSG
jgi:CCR4-NOT transcription complex subunit 6